MDYSLIRSSRKTLAVSITQNCEVVVRAPKRCPEHIIREFVNRHEAWITSHLEKQRARNERMPEPDEEEKARLIAEAKILLPARTAYYAQLMGLFPSGIRITSARTRFGSCSAKNAICYSWRLMRYPQEAIDYVVVHELAHILHKNHGRAFYQLVSSVLPDYKEREKLLRE